MLFRYVWMELIRNPRRTLSTTIGVILGVGLTCAILFFVDGLSASMTQRAVAPLPIDMQRVLTAPIGADTRLRLNVEPTGFVNRGDIVRVRLTFLNQGKTPANEVIIRSIPAAGLTYVGGSARLDGAEITVGGENPFASGAAKTGLNIGTVAPGAEVFLEYQATAAEARNVTEQDIAATFSTREALIPIPANMSEPPDLADLARQIAAVDGVAFAEQLSFVDLPPGTLSAELPVDGAVRVFGFDPGYTTHDATIRLVSGTQTAGEALISAEAAEALGVSIGDVVTLALPDGTQLSRRISGVVDLTRARSLFSSRQGADLETFVYIPSALVLDAAAFNDTIIPAFERAASERGERVKSPPVREVDMGVERELLNADPVLALEQTRRIAAAVVNVAGEHDFVLDNISNTLAVARDDAVVARRMFIFLGVPGAILAAVLAAYAGLVLSGAQRREQATLRIRGASRRHLLALLAMRVSCITVGGAGIGVALGYATAVAIVGQETLMRAATGSLIQSAVLGIIAGLLATGGALYISGRRSIEREINEDRARLWSRRPAWQMYYLDIIGLLTLLIITVIVVANAGFEGRPGSIYTGRAVELSLGLLFLPLAMWIAGSFFGGRFLAAALAQPWLKAAALLNWPLPLLYTMTLRRRAWNMTDAAIILGLIIGLGTSLAIFTNSYNGAKAADARYIVGSDMRITPSPTSERKYSAADAAEFAVAGVEAVTPVVYGVHNVILRSLRTSDVANLAAIDPQGFLQVAPLEDSQFEGGSAANSLRQLTPSAPAILLSRDMADFLQTGVGDTLWALLARGTSEQVEIEMEVVGLFERAPGFPDGVHALIHIAQHEAAVASTSPAFFLAQAGSPDDQALQQAVVALHDKPEVGGSVQIDTRLTALAKDQSSLAALNIDGLLKIDSSYSLAMGTVAVMIFVFGLLLQRRREYVTLRAQGMSPVAIRLLIGSEAGTAALTGCLIGLPVGLAMAYYFINVLRPLFILDPLYRVPMASLGTLAGSVLAATALAAVVASALVNQLRATELLRDE